MKREFARETPLLYIDLQPPTVDLAVSFMTDREGRRDVQKEASTPGTQSDIAETALDGHSEALAAALAPHSLAWDLAWRSNDVA